MALPQKDTDEVSIDEEDMINGSEVPIDELDENDYLDDQMDCAEHISDKRAGNHGQAAHANAKICFT
uniref:Zinc finger protein n=1 Tax=Globodera pallida TaxID=36090 RepID=A0A183C128_GLOPA